MAYTVNFTSLGCAKNLVDSEQMLCLLDEAGFSIEPSPEGCDVAVVNTCGFIESAKMEAIDNILWLGELKRNGKLGKIVVAGCLSERYKDELRKEMPEIDAMVGVGSVNEIVNIISRALDGEESVSSFTDISAPLEEIGRVITTGPAWAYIKIAEGCDNRCAYCVIPSIRGRFRSRPMESILDEAAALAETGVKELIVVAQDITRYGSDLYGKRSLAELLQKLCRIDGLEWIRLHYLYAEEIDDELIDVIAGSEKILPYLDIPIQHVDDDILRKMNRRDTSEGIRALFAKLRARIPGLVLRTSIIVGLPGEDEEKFDKLCAFLREAKIERAGVFTYSPEEGTPAAEMDRPDEDTARRRAELVQDIQSQIMDAYSETRIGCHVRVLCEGYDAVTKCWYGRSFAESPDVDGRIFFTGEDITPGSFQDVIITEVLDGEPLGEKA